MRQIYETLTLSGILINLKQFLNIQNLRYYHSTTFHKNIVCDNLHLSYIIEHISCHKCCDIDQQNERFRIAMNKQNSSLRTGSS